MDEEEPSSVTAPKEEPTVAMEVWFLVGSQHSKGKAGIVESPVQVDVAIGDGGTCTTKKPVQAEAAVGKKKPGLQTVRTRMTWLETNGRRWDHSNHY